MTSREFGAFLIRYAAMMGACVWVGGFMFYGGVVVPILDEALGSTDAGMITREVTDGLNLVGAATLAAWAVLVVVEWRRGPRWAVWSRCALVAASASALAALFVLHNVMDAHLDERGLGGFRPLHRQYLVISTAQWGANLLILALGLGIGTGLGRASRSD